MKNNNSSRSNSNNSPSNATTNNSDRKKAKIRSKNKRSPNSKQNDLIAQLQLQGDHYMLKIEEEKQCIDRLERDLEDLEKKEEDNVKKILQERLSAKESPKTIRRREKAIEDRLVIDIQNLNNLFSTNTMLQNQVNDYRQERMKLVSFIKGLDEEMSTGKNKLKEYLKKIDVQSKINNTLTTDVKELKKLILKEEKEHQALIVKLSDTIDRDKLKSRNTKIDLERKRKKDMGEEDEELKEREMEVRQAEVKLKKKKVQGAWKLAKQRAHLKFSTAKIRKYEHAFNGILRTKNIGNLNELVNVFVSSSRRDIEMVNKLNKLTLQTDQCNREIQELWQDIDSRRAPMRNAEETVNQRIVRELEEKILRFQDHQNQYNQQFQYSNTIVNDMKHGVYEIASHLACLPNNSTQSIYSHYGGSTGGGDDDDGGTVAEVRRGSFNDNINNMNKGIGLDLSDKDMIKTVALIEQRLNEIIELSYNFTPDDQVKDINIANRGPNMPARLKQKDLRKSVVEKQRKISELEKKLNELGNNINNNDDNNSEENAINKENNNNNQLLVKEEKFVDLDEFVDNIGGDEDEKNNTYSIKAPSVNITKTKKPSIPKRLTRIEIEKSLSEKFSI